MKHATDTALDQLGDLLEDIRGIAGLVERKRGVFYHRGRAFLHFHEDPAGLFADVRTADGWERLPADTIAQRRAVLRLLRAGIEPESNHRE